MEPNNGSPLQGTIARPGIGGGHTDDRTQVRGPIPLGPQPPVGGMTNGRPNLAGNLIDVGREATSQLDQSLDESVDVLDALDHTRDRHVKTLKAKRDKLDSRLNQVDPPMWTKFPGNSPAPTIGAIVGFILAVLFLFNVQISAEQVGALTEVVGGAMFIGPTVGGFLVKYVNTPR